MDGYDDYYTGTTPGQCRHYKPLFGKRDAHQLFRTYNSSRLLEIIFFILPLPFLSVHALEQLLISIAIGIRGSSCELGITRSMWYVRHRRLPQEPKTKRGHRVAYYEALSTTTISGRFVSLCLCRFLVLLICSRATII